MSSSIGDRFDGMQPCHQNLTLRLGARGFIIPEGDTERPFARNYRGLSWLFLILSNREALSGEPNS